MTTMNTHDGWRETAVNTAKVLLVGCVLPVVLAGLLAAIL